MYKLFSKIQIYGFMKRDRAPANIHWIYPSYCNWSLHITLLHQYNASATCNVVPSLKPSIPCHDPHINNTIIPQLHDCILPKLQVTVAWCIHPAEHGDAIKLRHFLYNWPFVPGIHRSLVIALHKGQWCRVLMFSLICASINDWVNNWEAGDLRCHRTHYDVTVMTTYLQNITGQKVCPGHSHMSHVLNIQHLDT